MLSGVVLSDNYTLCSLDVVSLFTNIPVNLALEAVARRWRFIKNNTKISLTEFLLAVEFVLSSMYFSFNNIIYRQTYGTPMGSPLSPIIADITLQDLELKALNTLKFNIPLYYKYVDDIILSFPKDKLDDVLNSFNSIHHRLKFTHELQSNDQISFLDLSVILRNNTIICDTTNLVSQEGT
ncbi:uncharacterized protein LOC109861110 [Pseudomyrmex gracilis]|uniref:uncharacterized protein LOC109861110 n=1 Tax=Pseudomyrmex gracilis TaxID=219809 RepID=UPI000995C1A1|nr:uncharacterized protein LOC109861110 [Pseudomyrmex gracilis]